MRIVTTARELGDFRGGVLVPTMGALHAGHLALVSAARAEAARRGGGKPVVVSVFVNPTQFNDPKDLDRYPRTLDADSAGCERAGADIVFAPSPDEVYPPGQLFPTPALPAVAAGPGLEDASRPGHFAGVCQVVERLFELVRPAAAIFGEKDWQQLKVIEAMARDLRPDLSIIAHPTAREPDGLAMSSRNVFLTPADRSRARALWRGLAAARDRSTPMAAEAAMREVLEREGIAIEYAVVRDAWTLLGPVEGCASRALVAARLGTVRLIDNAEWRGDR